MTHEPLIIVVKKNQQFKYISSNRSTGPETHADRQRRHASIIQRKSITVFLHTSILVWFGKAVGETADFMKPTFSSRHTKSDCHGSQFSTVQSPHVASPELLKLEGLMALVLVSKTLPAKKGLKSKSLFHYPAYTTKVSPSLISCDFVNSLNFGKVGFF